MRVLHLHSSFHAGGKELRAAQLINAFGRQVSHTIVSAQPGALGAASAIDPRMDVSYPADFPPLAGRPFPRRLQGIAAAMRGFDLVLTYNWGAMDAVMAHSLFSEHLGLPPLVHHEDGFNQDEASRLKTSRNLFRRLALWRTSTLVVPSRRLETIARDVWHQPPGKVRRIVNGINTAAYAGTPRPNALPRVVKRQGECWIGTLAGLRPVKNLPRLVRAVASLPDYCQLVILGEGPEREAIRAEAMRLNIAHRVHLPGFVAEPAKAVGLFDIFALSSDSEQFPISVVEAMAAGLPVVATHVGDVAAMVAAENRGLIVAAGDEDSLATQLSGLVMEPQRRMAIGKANRVRARAEYDEQTMVSAYRAVYAQALKRPTFP